MRAAFINTITQEARKDKDIFLLTGDLGFSVLEDFRKEFCGRFFNIGVAEANMVGIAAGLALCGKKVFVYSIASFVTTRCLEQIRNDVCYQNLNVKIIGVGSGLSYGSAGATHYSIEDIAMMRALPNLTVICPGDPLEVELAIKESCRHDGPMYIRLGKGKEPKVHETIENFTIGKGIILNNGSDIAIIATGNMLYNAKQAADRLIEKGISVRLISMHTVKPIDRDLVIRAAKETKAIFTVEEHSLIGGLGSAVAEILAEEESKVSFKRIALPDIYALDVGSQEYLRKKYGLSTEAIAQNILQAYEEIKIR
jgi:transketolase